MSGLSILLEQAIAQSEKTMSELLDDGWSIREPRNWAETHDRIKSSDGYIMYKPKPQADPEPEEESQGNQENQGNQSNQGNQGGGGGSNNFPEMETDPNGESGGVESGGREEVEVSEDQKLRDDLKSLFEKIKFYEFQADSRDGVPFPKKPFTDEEKENVITWIVNNTPSADGTDDRFVHGIIHYMLTHGHYPYYYTWTPGVTGIDGFEGVTQIDESKIGLLAVLLEQSSGARTNVVYVYAPELKAGIVDYQLFQGIGADRHVTSLYASKLTKQPAPEPNKQAQDGKPSGETPANTEPEKRPEEELGNSNRMIVAKASKEGVDAILPSLSDEQKRILQGYYDEDYTTERPADKDMQIMDMVDLAKQESVFADFKTFPIYRPKRMTEQNLESYADMLDAQNVDRKMCKTTVKMFYDAAMEKKRLSVNVKKQYADYITACKNQIKVFGIGNTKKKIDKLENEMGSNPSYEINYSARTVGGNKF